MDPTTPEGALARGATHLILLGERGVLAEGTPAELSSAARVYRLTVPANAEPLRAALAERGLTLQRGPLHFTVELPDGASTTLLLEAAASAKAPVIELSPLFG
ncbi:MAG: hypothetical protein R3B70_10935 [Polyangiaceae bacterium]